MTQDIETRYRTLKSGDRLVFRTEHFAQTGESVLHGGIFNRELSSLLASVAVATALSLVFFLQGKRSYLYYVLILVVLFGAFPLFRTFVFRDRFLEAVFSAATGRTEILIPGFVGKTRKVIERGGIGSLLVEKRATQVDNPDAVEFVERISAQHGASIPHFEKEISRYLLFLKLTDGGDILLFADGSMEHVIAAHAEIRDFLESNRMLAAAA